MQSIENIFDAETLNPDLQPYLFRDGRLGQCIKHPLVFSIMHREPLNRFINETYKQKKEKLDCAVSAKDWSQFVWLHERPYRLSAFLQIEHKLSDKEYWSLLGSVWIDTENYFQNKRLWHDCFNSSRPSRKAIMTRDDLKVYKSLPDTLTIYRGREPGDVYEVRGSNYLSKFGPSWTVNIEVARRFARRFQSLFRKRSKLDRPIIFKATCSKRDAIGYLDSRGEEEVLIFPKYLRDVRVIAK